jgi:hypothetical protein
VDAIATMVLSRPRILANSLPISWNALASRLPYLVIGPTLMLPPGAL